jgi:hypothetical protein
MFIHDSVEKLRSSALVINGHGVKTTDSSFNLNDHVLLTPDKLDAPYLLSVKFAVEKKLRQGYLPHVHNGNWTVYGKGSMSNSAPDVNIRPWNNDTELSLFSRRITTETNLWSEIDCVTGYYCERDADVRLILRNADGSLSYLDQSHSAEYFKTVVLGTKRGDLWLGSPIFLYAPQVAKVKILGKTTLKEISDAIRYIAGSRLLVLLTCNSGQNDKLVHLVRHAREVSISVLLATACEPSDWTCPS